MSSEPAREATACPAGVLPVSVTAATSGAAITSATRPEETRSARKRPGGVPASAKIRSMASAQPETLPACFSTPALPAMSAGAAKRKTCQRGKFQGMTASTTPSGAKAT